MKVKCDSDAKCVLHMDSGLLSPEILNFRNPKATTEPGSSTHELGPPVLHLCGLDSSCPFQATCQQLPNT